MKQFIDPPALVQPAKDLAELAARISADYQAAESSRADMLARYRRMGENLLEAKKQCKHGQWSSWLKKNVNFSERKAQRFMQFAKSDVTSDLDDQEASWQRCSGNVSSEDGTEETSAEPDAVARYAGNGAVAEREWTADERQRREAVLAGKTVVANLREGTDERLIHWARENGLLVVIDHNTPWGNPFLCPQDGGPDEVCERYRAFLSGKPSLLSRLGELRGKVLACWCYPQQCHGQILADLVNSEEAHQQRGPEGAPEENGDPPAAPPLPPPAVPLLTPPLKCHGGKGAHHSRLARWIVDLMRAAPHTHYVEPFAGGLAVLLAKDPKGVSEMANDLDGRIMNFWEVLRDEQLFPRFLRQAQAIPLSRRGWKKAAAHAYGSDPVADAVAFFVLCRQSLAGRRKSFTSPTRKRVRRGRNGNVSEWQGAVKGLPAVYARLQRVFFENLPALDLVRREDRPETLFYLDPPYFHPTRTDRKVYGAFEMTETDHRELLDLLPSLKGKVILSGYPSELYDAALKDWNRHAFKVPNNAAGGKKKEIKTEVVWCNF
jgi:DNA adenine methylase